ncbi:hypothetical protein L195_g061412, partial [Trifolium pratense]
MRRFSSRIAEFRRKKEDEQRKKDEKNKEDNRKPQEAEIIIISSDSEAEENCWCFKVWPHFAKTNDQARWG